MGWAPATTEPRLCHAPKAAGTTERSRSDLQMSRGEARPRNRAKWRRFRETLLPVTLPPKRQRPRRRGRQRKFSAVRSEPPQNSFASASDGPGTWIRSLQKRSRIAKRYSRVSANPESNPFPQSSPRRSRRRLLSIIRETRWETRIRAARRFLSKRFCPTYPGANRRRAARACCEVGEGVDEAGRLPSINWFPAIPWDEAPPRSPIMMSRVGTTARLSPRSCLR